VAVAPVSADQPAQVPAPVGGGLLGRLGEAAGAHQAVAGRQVRTPPQPAEPARGDVLPPALGQEAVIAAADELSAVLEQDPVGGLDRGPVRQHGGADILAAAATPDRSVDPVPGPQLSQRLGPAVRHQDRRLAFQAVTQACWQPR
jgi:hypothetical protein